MDIFSLSGVINLHQMPYLKENKFSVARPLSLDQFSIVKLFKENKPPPT